MEWKMQNQISRRGKWRTKMLLTYHYAQEGTSHIIV